jgi:electron transport complex protein RnfE
MGSGFMIAMLIMGSVREIIGNGSWANIPLFGHHYQPWIIMILPPGGFFTLGFVLLAMGWKKGRRAEAMKPRHWPHGVTTEVGGTV